MLLWGDVVNTTEENLDLLMSSRTGGDFSKAVTNLGEQQGQAFHTAVHCTVG